MKFNMQVLNSGPLCCGHPPLLLLFTGAWLIYGAQGIAQILWAIYSSPYPFGWGSFVFAVGLALPYFLSVLGGIQLLRKKRSAVGLFIGFFLFYIVCLLSSEEDIGISDIALLGIPGITIGYGLILKKKGVLA